MTTPAATGPAPTEDTGSNGSRGQAFFSAAKLIAAWTMLSRVLGLVRESLLTALFGAGWVLDSFYLAFQLPNLFRRLFGEGALSAALVPVFTEERQRDEDSAWRLASGVVTILVAGLGLLTLAGQAVLLAVWAAQPDNPERAMFCRLAMIMLVFFPLICLVAVMGGLLSVLGRFAAAAVVPSVLNLVMIAAAVVPLERFTGGDTNDRITGVAVGVAVAGLAELAIMVTALRWAGGRLGWGRGLSHPGLRRVAHLMGPMILGLGVLQIMEFVNAAVVRGLTAPADQPGAILTLAGYQAAYPLEEGSLTVLQCAQRLYQFPLGVFATALGTAVFPLLSLYAARGDRAGLMAAVVTAVRLAVFVGLPAGVGLALTAEGLCRLLFERGSFTPHDTARTATIVVWYGVGMAGFCLHQIVARAYYALQEARTPTRVSVALLPVNLALNVGLAWVPGVGVAGVAIATSATFTAGALWMLAGLRSHLGQQPAANPWPALLASLIGTGAATAAMAAVVSVCQTALPPAVTALAWGGGTLGQVVIMAATVTAGMVTFTVVAHSLGRPELRELLARKGSAMAAAVD